MFFRAVQSAAYLAGRDFVIPDDVQKMAVHVLPHRLSLTPKARYGSLTRLQVVQEIVSEVPVPA